MKECPLRFDTPPALLAESLHEHGWIVEDLERWYAVLFEAFLLSGGLDQVPEAIIAAPSWEMVLPGEE